MHYAPEALTPATLNTISDLQVAHFCSAILVSFYSALDKQAIRHLAGAQETLLTEWQIDTLFTTSSTNLSVGNLCENLTTSIVSGHPRARVLVPQFRCIAKPEALGLHKRSEAIMR